MKPRDFINFFRTKSGKLVVFALVFGGGLVLFGVIRDGSRSPDEMDVRVSPATPPTDSPQVVQTILRPSEPYRPPPAKREPPPVPKGATNDLARVVPHPEPPTPPEPPPPEIPPIGNTGEHLGVETIGTSGTIGTFGTVAVIKLNDLNGAQR